MKEWLVDTNVILDVIGADPEFGASSRAALEQAAEEGALVIDPIIYGEVGALVETIEELDGLLPESLFRRDHIPWEAAYLAGRALHAYRRGGGGRARLLPDFLVGAHAAVSGFGLLTRDRAHARRFRVEVWDPSAVDARE